MYKKINERISMIRRDGKIKRRKRHQISQTSNKESDGCGHPSYLTMIHDIKAIL